MRIMSFPNGNFIRNFRKILPNVKLKLQAVSFVVIITILLGNMMNISLPIIAIEDTVYRTSLPQNELLGDYWSIGNFLYTIVIYLSSMSTVYANQYVLLSYMVNDDVKLDIHTKVNMMQTKKNTNDQDHNFQLNVPVMTSSCAAQTQRINFYDYKMYCIDDLSLTDPINITDISPALMNETLVECKKSNTVGTNELEPPTKEAKTQIDDIDNHCSNIPLRISPMIYSCATQTDVTNSVTTSPSPSINGVPTNFINLPNLIGLKSTKTQHKSALFISTAIRILPPLNDEISQFYFIGKNSVDFDNATLRNHYAIDHVFDQNSITDDLFSYYVNSMKFTTGNDPSIFIVIGGTGTGKTYTLTGEDRFDDGDTGLIGRTLMNYITDYGDKLDIKVSAAEITLKSVVDICRSKSAGISTNSHNIDLISHRRIASTNDVNAFIALIKRKRTTKITHFNNRSSRSHLVIKVIVGNDKNVLRTTIFLDLAGFEPINNQDSHSSSFINSTLLTIQNVLRAIVTKSTQIPFRDSVITKIMQPYLLCQCKIYVLGTVALKGTTRRMDSSTLKFLSSLTGKKKRKIT